MYPVLIFFLNFFFFLLIAFYSAIYIPFSGFYILLRVITKKEKFEDAIRYNNQMYGRTLIKIASPFIKIRCFGFDKIPDEKSFVIVLNHRSYTDIILSTLVPVGNLTVFLRSWPFKIFPFNIYMYLGQYVDIEKNSIENIIKERGEDLVRRGSSFIFFPEGHRSRDGKLQRFGSGAFLFASELNIPILPVCIKGAEKITPKRGFVIHPASVSLEILPVVYPKDFQSEKKAYKIKKYVENLFRKHLNENLID